VKVVIIGAGSLLFTREFINDMMCVPEFRDHVEFVLHDVHAKNLDRVYHLCKRDMESNKVGSKISATLDRRRALKGAHYIFCSVRVGGLEAYEQDVKIPLKYGVAQCVGDTLCAGGIMYAQRTIPVMLDFCRDAAELAHKDCLFISHVNPMAMNTWACNQYGGVRFVGLCHGVFHGAHQIAGVLGIPAKELDYICAGINHQTWFIRLRHKGKDVSGKLLAAFEKDSEESRKEKVRIDVLRRFGYYSTESNGHLSEYLAWYRKRPSDLKNWIDLERWQGGETCGYVRVLDRRRNDFDRDFPKLLKQEPWPYLPDRRSPEHGSHLIEGLETGHLYRGHFNMPNKGLITNLPQDAIVEVPGYVDGNGINMPVVGDLPLGCAAVCNASISVQRISVEAAVHGDIDLLRQAMMMDPLVGAVCNPPEIWRMTDEMLVAQARWLPQYKKEVAKAARRLAQALRVSRKKPASCGR